jgi:hypothetical protein
MFVLNTAFTSQDAESLSIDEEIRSIILPYAEIDEGKSIQELEREKYILLQLYSQRKSPFAASLMSMVYAGTGQFYTRNYTKGSLLFLGETVLYLLHYGLRLQFNETYGQSVSFFEMSGGDQFFLVGSFALILSLKIYGMYDAYNSAIEFNKKLADTMRGVQFSYNSEGFSVTYNYRF